MKRRFARFWTTAMIGYAIVVLMLAGGMILATERFDSVATLHVNRIRTEENQITFAERLRWSGEAIVSTGRGYLISGDPAFLGRLEEAQVKFDKGIHALTQGATDSRTTELVSEIERNAIAFRRHQEVLVASMRNGEARMIATRFDSELVPLQRTLGESLDRMIDYKESAIDNVYERVARERARLRTRVVLFLGILVVGSLAISAYIAGLLGRSYRKEQDALETSRRAVAARDEIMGVVAHDLRNPLTSIAMRAELLAETNESESVRKHGTAIEAVTRRMEALIKTMLDVATIESGHFTVNPESCMAKDLLDETIQMFGDLAARKQIRLEQAPLAFTTRVRADRERILQVLGNLVGNAIKFTPQGGQIVLSAEQEADMIRFGVADSGPGIPNEYWSAVFNRFWKNETGGKKGTGLGLFIAKGIVDAHGGRIWVENGTPHGAVFYFMLPIAEASVSSIPGARIAATRYESSERGLH